MSGNSHDVLLPAAGREPETEMSALVSSYDWSKTPLGSIATWSPTLKATTRFLLANRFPLLLWWGPHYISIYNDAYRPILGAKHPWALGQPVEKCWSEIWDILKPLIDRPFHGGPATWNEDLALELNRYGQTEETHFTVAYSSVPDETEAHGIGGVIATVHETTKSVIGERRMRLLHDLSASLIQNEGMDEIYQIIASSLGHYSRDIPFALLYSIDENVRTAELIAAVGISAGSRKVFQRVILGETAAPWPLHQAIGSGQIEVVSDLSSRFGPDAPRGPWADPPQQAVVVPVGHEPGERPRNVMVAGVSARLHLDDDYRRFYRLIADQIASALVMATSFENEKKRLAALASIDRAKTVFFANISHEFRTPLSLIAGPVDELLENPSEELPASSRRALQIVQRNTRRLMKLVNSLLDFSRVEGQRIKARFEETDLAGLTTQLASNFRSACEQAGLVLEVDCPMAAPGTATAYIDHDMWETIVLNLVSNAFKFTFSGRIAVKLAMDGDCARLIVQDTGIGIPRSALPRIFDRFYRVENSRGRTHEGAGIGLALVHELVKLHGGTLKAESEPDHGSTFTVTIPLGKNHLDPESIVSPGQPVRHRSNATAYVEEARQWLSQPGVNRTGRDSEAYAGPLSAPAADATGDLGRGRVLVADDNADMRDYIAHLLSQQYSIELARDGQEALDAIIRASNARQLPDLVICDVMMPRLDGLELLQKLRGNPSFSRMPVMLLSARAGEEARIEGLQRGADDYVTKPFNARELLARVEAQFKLSRLRHSAERSLRDNEERLRLALSAGKMAIWEWNVSTGEIRWNDEHYSLLGYEPHSITPSYRAWRKRVLKEDLAEVEAVIRKSLDSGDHYHAIFRVHGKSDEVRWLEAHGQIYRPSDGTARRMYGVMFDVTERIASERQMQLLLSEVNHRAKNLLAVVQSIAQLTSEDESPEHFYSSFSGRLIGLAACQDLLVESNWHGVELSALIRSQLVHLGSPAGSRIALSGEELILNPMAAQTIGMALHELATNSVKYGSLSGAEGKVDIEWRVSSEQHAQFSLIWRERNGPPVSPPSRFGFGHTLMVEMPEYALKAKVALLFEPGGLVWMLEGAMEDIDRIRVHL